MHVSQLPFDVYCGIYLFLDPQDFLKVRELSKTDSNRILDFLKNPYWLNQYFNLHGFENSSRHLMEIRWCVRVLKVVPDTALESYIPDLSFNATGKIVCFIKSLMQWQHLYAKLLSTPIDQQALSAFAEFSPFLTDEEKSYGYLLSFIDKGMMNQHILAQRFPTSAALGYYSNPLLSEQLGKFVNDLARHYIDLEDIGNDLPQDIFAIFWRQHRVTSLNFEKSCHESSLNHKRQIYNLLAQSQQSLKQFKLVLETQEALSVIEQCPIAQLEIHLMDNIGTDRLDNLIEKLNKILPNIASTTQVKMVKETSRPRRNSKLEQKIKELEDLIQQRHSNESAQQPLFTEHGSSVYSS